MKNVAIGTISTLEYAEAKVVEGIGRQRYLANRKAGVHNAKVVDGGDIKNDVDGLGAEYAFCKLFNVMPDLTIGIRSAKNGEDGGDAILHNGLSVDVKSTSYETGRLISVPWKSTNSHVDLYCLMTGECPTYTFRGFYRREDLFLENNKLELRKGNISYGVKQDKLKTLEEISAAILS